ncbi:1-deoxy-D-xylulose-5-phosphate reductoisomerase [Dermabacteraceae bacterium TAE3-ERU27]|nr:1-deoxy-D-xylulose-5-phosphate reductoisomerase [Dermabacteraceae bacterium TAE3-ERU27]
MTRRIALLGATGSIGTQAVEVVARYPQLGQIVSLASTGSRPQLLAQQVESTGASTVAISDSANADAVRAQLRARGLSPRLLVGPDAVETVAGELGGGGDGSGDVVLNAVTGSVGLRPTLAALASGARLALANKESLVAGGELVTAAAGPGQLLPVDSEHTAIAQCLAGVRPEAIDALVITASGGPFRGRSRAELGEVTPAQALNHPTWNMGRVITTNSATMVNKALEVIEAAWLFNLPLARVEVVVHPQSIVHSMVRLVDGATIAELSPPDMRHAIGWALAYPEKLPGLSRPSDFTRAQSWDFMPLDEDAFPAIRIARAAHARGGVAMACYNAANEEAVDAFHEGRLSFTGIVDLLADVLADPALPQPATLTVDEIAAAEAWARSRARELIGAAQ